MAEYNDVIKQFKRMCRYYNNRATQNDCPLYCKGHGCNISHCRLLAFEDKKFANVVMSWAAEHLAPVYPTWEEWLNSMGLTKHDTGQFCVHTPNQYSYEVKGVDILNEAAYKPIPADLAQKLGIEPKEG